LLTRSAETLSAGSRDLGITCGSTSTRFSDFAARAGGHFGFFGTTLGHHLLSFENSVGNSRSEQSDRSQSVVVTGDNIVNTLWRAVRINNRDDGDSQTIGFSNGDLFFANVDDENHVWQAAHVLDA
jgi:hypothetical protein